MNLHVAPRFNMNMLYEIRCIRGYSLTDLADALGIPQRTMRRYAGGREEPTPEHLEAMAKLLQVPVTFFYRPGKAMRQYAPLPTAWEPVFPTEARTQRKRAAELLADIPDEALGEVLAVLTDLAEYGPKVTRFGGEK